MKKIYILSAVMLAGLHSCELDYLPYNAIEQTAAFQTINDARSMREYFPLALRNNFTGEAYYSSDIQADLLNATLSYGNVQGFLYRWDLQSSDYTVENLWRDPYSRLKNVNNFIDNASSIVAADDDEAAEMVQYVSEAHLTRAILYRSLILRYAKDYEPATAAADLGVPLVLSYNINATPARSTVEQVYAQILADIAKAKEGLNGTAGAQNAKYLTADCITALEAQVYLEMHRYAEAAAAAASLIDGGKYPLVATAADLQKMWTNDNATEIIFQPIFAEYSEVASANTVPYYITYNNTDYLPLYVPEQWVVDLYDDSDIRKGVFIEQYDIKVNGTAYSDIWLINKYAGNPALKSSPTASPNYANSPKIFRIAEMYLIKAEAEAESGSDAAASATLNALRTSRGLSAASLSGSALKTEIQQERTREMLCEGTRLYDLKRWKQDGVRSAPQNMDLVIAAPANLTVELNKAADDYMFVWGIPSNDIKTAHLEQNPGW